MNRALVRAISKYLFAVRPGLLWGLAVATAAYLSISLVFSEIPEIFPGAYELSVMVSALSLSYISSFVFYFVVVHMKEVRDRENISEYVGNKVNGIIIASRLFVQPIQEKNGQTRPFDVPTEEQLWNLLATVNRYHHEAPLVDENGKHANWVEWWEWNRKSVLEDIDQIMARVSLLDTELIKLVTRVQNSVFLSQFNLLYMTENPLTDLTPLASQLSMYYRVVGDLERYCEKFLSAHKFLTSEFVGYARGS